jgi:ketosteroid isomerase-like protein
VTDGSPGATLPVMTESNVELARRGFAAALRGDLDAIAELLAPDVRWHGGDPAAAGACQNREQALAFMRRSEVIRGRSVELVDVVDAGDKVVVVMQPPGDGPQVANVVSFRDGEAVEMVHYANAADALAAARS